MATYTEKGLDKVTTNPNYPPEKTDPSLWRDPKTGVQYPIDPHTGVPFAVEMGLISGPTSTTIVLPKGGDISGYPLPKDNSGGPEIGLLGGSLASQRGAYDQINKATNKVITAPAKIAATLASPFGWLKELFSAQLWDRILFVLGGVALVIIGLVFMLHKSLPSPI